MGGGCGAPNAEEAFGDGGVGFVGDAGGYVVGAFGDVGEKDAVRLRRESR